MGKNGSIRLHEKNLRLVVIQFQYILCHPDFHVRDACLHGEDSGVYLIRRTGLKELRVTSKRTG